jgi:hypothetical protein
MIVKRFDQLIIRRKLLRLFSRLVSLAPIRTVRACSAGPLLDEFAPRMGGPPADVERLAFAD